MPGSEVSGTFRSDRACLLNGWKMVEIRQGRCMRDAALVARPIASQRAGPFAFFRRCFIIIPFVAGVEFGSRMKRCMKRGFLMNVWPSDFLTFVDKVRYGG